MYKILIFRCKKKPIDEFAIYSERKIIIIA